MFALEPYRSSLCAYVTYLARIVVAEVAISLGLPDRCWAGEPTREKALTLLQSCLKTQRNLDRVSMRVTTHRDIQDSVGDWPRYQRAESFIRRDGDRLDVSWRYFFPNDDSQRFKKRSYRARAVITREMGVLYFCGLDMIRPWAGIVNNDWDNWFTGHGINETTSGSLDGYFPPSATHRVGEVMAEESTELRVRATEDVGGTSCSVVEAKTRHGTYAMWIAESQGFLPLKVTYEIGPDDLHDYWDDRPFSQTTIPTPDGQSHAGTWSTGLLDEVTITRISDTFVPVAGRFTRTGWFGDIRLFAINSYKRTEIDLKPRFEGTDAFVTDLPDGSMINNMADQTSGVQYEWKGGKAVPAGAGFGGSVPTPSWESRSSGYQYVLAALGLAFFGIGMTMAIRSSGSLGALLERTQAS